MYDKIIQFRHLLHKHPELSGLEEQTAKHVCEFFTRFKPDQIHTNVGKNGLIVVFGSHDAPCVILRSDLDAVPIQESSNLPYVSRNFGVAHKCGHDGHIAILAAVAAHLSDNPPENIRVALLFQPEEETGEGSKAIVEAPIFKQLAPKMIFGLHNVPGYEKGQILLRKGTFCCASRGLTITLTGKTAHAAQPETGCSPAAVMAQLIVFAENIREHTAVTDPLSFCTVVGARLGEKAFGTAPAKAELYITIRSASNREMTEMVKAIELETAEKAGTKGLGFLLEYSDVFEATTSDDDCVDLIEKANPDQTTQLESPFRWSEDFGVYTRHYPGAFFGLGSGLNTPPLHHPDYDFPDDLIEQGATVFLNIIGQCKQALQKALSDLAYSTFPEN